MALRSVRVRKAKAVKLAQLEQLTATLSLAHASQLAVAASIVDRKAGLTAVRGTQKAIQARIDDALACPYPGYTRDLRELALALESFRRQEAMILRSLDTRKSKRSAPQRTPARQRPAPTPAKESISPEAPLPTHPPPPA